MYLTRAVYHDIGVGWQARKRRDGCEETGRFCSAEYREWFANCTFSVHGLYTIEYDMYRGPPLFLPLLSRIRLVYRMKVLFSSFRNVL